MTSAMDSVLEQARAQGAQRVHRVVLKIGTLSGVEPEALKFAFEVVARDTLAENAELVIDSVPARAFCATCSEEFGPDGGFIMRCPRCNDFSGDLRQGRELELSQIEMS